MKKTRILRIIVWSISFSFACNAFAVASERPADKIRIGASPVVSSAGIFIAYEKGYFRDEGIDPDLTYFKGSGAPMVALLGSNDLDVGAGNISAGLWNAINSGLDIKLVADKGSVNPQCDYIGLLVRKDHITSKRYKTLADLKGFKMAATAFGVSQQIAADRFLKSVGSGIQDVTFEKMDYAAMNLALQSKEIDATIQLEPYLTEAKLKGFAVEVAGVNEVYPGQQSAAIMYAPGLVKDRPEVATRFMIAYLKGVRDYNNAFLRNKGKAAIIALLKEHVKIENERIWNKMIPAGINPDGYLNKASLAGDAQWYREHGFVDVSCDVEKAVDHSFVEKALARLGKFEQSQT